jgi:hypothetical protein
MIKLVEKVRKKYMELKTVVKKEEAVKRMFKGVNLDSLFCLILL